MTPIKRHIQQSLRELKGFDIEWHAEVGIIVHHQPYKRLTPPMSAESVLADSRIVSLPTMPLNGRISRIPVPSTLLH